MKTALIGVAATLSASAASAHGNAHLHPHGAETYIIAILLACLGAAAAVALRK